MKKITLLTLALLMMSVVTLAQKPLPTFNFVKFTPKNVAAPAFKNGVVKTPYKAEAASYIYTFRKGTNGWTTIDADGDGNDWYMLNNSTILGHDGEPGMMTSASYASVALNPDNYLVSPKMKLDGSISFYANAQDAAWAAEHFAVMVSTAGGTDPSDFTLVNEWTMTAAPSHKVTVSEGREATESEGREVTRKGGPRRAQGTWYLYTIDLSSYAGAEGYVAIRHFNCSDFFRLNVDDITLTTSQMIDPYDPSLEIKPELVTLPDGAEVTPYYTTSGTLAVYIDNNWKDYTKKVKNINVAIVGTDVYLQGLSYNRQSAWVKGTLAGNVITVPSGQYVGNDVYMNGINTETGDLLENYSFTLNTNDGTIASEGCFGESSSDTENVLYSYWISPVFSLTEPVDPHVTPPTGLVTEDWTIARYFYDGDYEEQQEKVIQIGFDNKDVYVKNFSYYLDDNWIKGTLSDDGKSITFASGQYYGSYSDTYDIWFAVNDLTTGEMANSVTVAYDAEAGTITWPDDIIILENGEENELSVYGYFSKIVATVRGTAPDPIAAPAGLATSEWLFKSQSMTEDPETGELVGTNYELHVQAGFDGNDIYIKGLCEDLPEAWIKGTLDPTTNKVTFPTSQHFGKYGYWFWEYDYFFAGYGQNGLEDIVMNYNPETQKLTMANPSVYMLVNTCWLMYNPNLILSEVVMQKVQDVAATPAQPAIVATNLTGTSFPNITVEVPAYDTEGNPILTSKLSYQYYSEVDHVASLITLTTDLYYELNENMTEIPYNFSDDWDIYPYRLYLNMDFSTWKRIGIQSIYRGGGEEHLSEIFWLPITNITFSSANDYTINSVLVDDTDKTSSIISNSLLRYVGEGSIVTISPAKGYKFSKVEAMIDEEHPVDVDLAEDGSTASFTMPYDNLTVNYEIEPIGFEVDIPAGEFITFYKDEDLKIEDADCQMLTVASVTGTEVVLSDPITIAPAETPLIVYNNSNKNKKIKLFVSVDQEPNSVTVAEEFKGSLDGQQLPASGNGTDYYILNGKQFVWVKNAGTIPANKCWLELSDGMDAAAKLNIVFGETTSINEEFSMKNEELNVFDLNGCKLKGLPTQKGIYIVNGKKVVIK